MAEKEFKENLVLCISQKGAHRESLSKELRDAGLETSYVTELSSVTDIIAEMRPGTLLHDWAAIEPSQAIGFQQRLGKIAEYAAMARIIYAPELTPQLIALSTDCGVKRVVSYSPNHATLVNEVKLTLSAMKHMSALQTLIVKAHADGVYDQTSVDKNVEDAFAQFPNDHAVKLEFGNLMCRRNELAKALAVVQEVIGAQPHNVRAMNLLAKIMMKEGKAAEAATILEKANVLSPFNTDRLVMLGGAFLSSGQPDKAASYFEQAMSIDPANADAQKGLGQVRLSEGDINGAIDVLKQSASEEESAGFFNSAAVVAARAGQYEKAIQLYEAALQLLHTNKYKPAVWYNMALSMEQLGKIEEALKLIKRVLKYDESFAKGQRQKQRLESKLNASGRKTA